MTTLPHLPARRLLATGLGIGTRAKPAPGPVRPSVKRAGLQDPTTTDGAGAQETFVLPKGGLRTWALAAGETVHLTSGHGHAWVSREGDPEDYVLGPEGPLHLAGPGLVVLEALEPGTFTAELFPRGQDLNSAPQG